MDIINRRGAKADSAPRRGSPSARQRVSDDLDAIVAAGSTSLVALRYPIQQGLNLGVLTALATIPLWLGSLWRRRFGPTALVLGCLSVLNGWLLTSLTTSHETSVSLLQMRSLQLVGMICGIGVLVWSMDRIGRPATAIWFGIGLLLALAWRSVDWTNPWKFDFQVPISVVVLGVTSRSLSRRGDALVLVALAVIGVFNDSRSASSMLMIAAGMLAWQVMLRTLSQHSTPLRTLVSMGLVGVLGYFFARTLILMGAFGAGTRERTLQQLEEAGSIILGGRPEIGATVALFLHNPWGFGAGTVPNASDINVAKSGMAALNYDPNNGYVERYMLGDSFELHSMIGDLWAAFGLPGAALLLLLLVIIVWGTARQLAARRATGLELYLLFQVGWDCFFSPLYFTTIGTLMLAVALAFRALDSDDTELQTDPSVAGALGRWPRVDLLARRRGE